MQRCQDQLKEILTQYKIFFSNGHGLPKMNLDTLRSEAFSYSSRNGQGLYTSYSDINDWIEIMSRPVSILPLCEICDVLKFPGITTQSDSVVNYILIEQLVIDHL